MDMRALTVAVLAVALVGGCASARGKMVYEKPGVTEEQKRADEAECTRAAIDTADQRGAVFLAVDRDVVDRCMQARSYRGTMSK